jgi:MOSC domain-containing protein
MPHLSRILIYPVKSLEPVSVDQISVLKSGALAGDRAFGLFDAEDKFVNGKRHPRVHHLRSAYDPVTYTLTLSRADSSSSSQFHIDRQRSELHEWLTEFFGFPVTLKHNSEVGFPDDLDCPGPTIISTATLTEVAGWFPPLDAAQLRLRLRANLELSASAPFWEERLYAAKGMRVRFRIGDVLFHGNNPCQRCVVPPRDPLTGEGYPNFAKIFAERRKQTLPVWAEASRFNHYYRLAINTLVPESETSRTLHVGDEITVEETILVL